MTKTTPPLLAALIVLVLAACAPLQSANHVRPPRTSAASPLEGTWTLLAADEIRPDGTRARAYGPHPRGTLIVDAEGRYSLQLFRSGRLRFASGVKTRGTAEEYMDTVLGMSSHMGRCHIEAASGLLVFEIELAQFPNWEGTVQRRSYTLRGDTLAYRIPVAASGNGTIPISEWVRSR